MSECLEIYTPEAEQQMTALVTQMGAMISAVMRRLDELEEKQRQITLTHDEVRAVQMLIRLRSAEYCEKYILTDPGSLRAVSAGIRRAVLNRYGVKDLHDVPAIARQAVEAQISRWSDIRLVMKRREALRESGA